MSSRRVRFHMAVDTPDNGVVSGYSYEVDLEFTPEELGSNREPFDLYVAVKEFVRNFVNDPANRLYDDLSDLDGRYQCKRR